MATKDPASLKLYAHSLSPVCRAVMWLLEVEQIPYEERTVELSKGILLLSAVDTANAAQ